MKKVLKFFFIVIIVTVVTGAGFALWAKDKYVVPIMMYHSINQNDNGQGNITTPENFRRHMAFLKENGYRVISLAELVEMTRAGTIPRQKLAVITFDDGFEDNYTQALPILKEFGFPAVIFTSTVTLGKEGWLKWYQVFELEQNNITIGSHTQTQAYLPDLDEQEQRQEIMGSKKILEDNLGHPVDFIAYPTGGFSPQIKALVRQAGYKAACTTNRGHDRYNRDVFELNRIRFSDADNRDIILKAKLSGYYNLFRRLRAPN